MRTIFIILLSFSQIFAFGQEYHSLRKYIMESEIILESSQIQSDTIFVNDFTPKITFHIDTKKAQILKNNTKTLPQKLTLQEYPKEVALGEKCITYGLAPNTHHYYLTFIKKKGKDYYIHLRTRPIEYEEFSQYTQQIKTLAEIEKITDEKQRFSKTLDWFIENNLNPLDDLDFTKYYRRKGFIKDYSNYLTASQYEKALEKFLKGSEHLTSVVKQKYPDKVKQYYIKKMEEILNRDSGEPSDVYEFQRAFSSIIINEDLGYDSMEYVLYNSLYEDNLDKYHKINVMKYLIKFAKEYGN